MATSFEDLVAKTYDRALARGKVYFFKSTVFKIREQDLEFEVRFVPDLKKKPISVIPEATEKVETVKSQIDPFAPYDPELFVQEYGRYVVLLNKFCVIPHHILIVTKEFEIQTDPISRQDFSAVWHYLMQIQSQKPLVFYNCGKDSGASQPHKHIQILPLSDQGGCVPPIEAYISRAQDKNPGEIFDFSQFKFIHHVVKLDLQCLNGQNEDEIGNYLDGAYNSLLDAMFESLRNHNHTDNNAPNNFSHNFLMTKTWMLIVPRTSEKCEQILVNSLGFAGMLLVREQEELAFMKSVGPIKFLDAVAASRVHL